MYRVSITDRGSFRATRVAVDPDTKDKAHTFESDYWGPFQTELRHRLFNETENPNVRETAPGKARRASDDGVL